MKKTITMALGMVLIIDSVNVRAEDITKLPASLKFEIKKEVERREHTSVMNVALVGADEAKAKFKGGVATVRFIFRDPKLNCNAGKSAECMQRFMDNPLGFTVLSYESKRN